MCLRKFPQEVRFLLGPEGSIETSQEAIESEIGQSLESRDRMGWEKMLSMCER